PTLTATATWQPTPTSSRSSESSPAAAADRSGRRNPGPSPAFLSQTGGAMGHLFLVSVVAAALCGSAMAQSIRLESIAPHTTDAAIISWNSPHIAALDTAQAH